MSNTQARLTQIFREVFENPALAITRQTTAEDIVEWDSLMHIQLIVAAEKQFDVRFGVGEVEKLQNVGDMLDLIDRKLAAAS